MSTYSAVDLGFALNGLSAWVAQTGIHQVRQALCLAAADAEIAVDSNALAEILLLRADGILERGDKVVPDLLRDWVLPAEEPQEQSSAQVESSGDSEVVEPSNGSEADDPSNDGEANTSKKRRGGGASAATHQEPPSGAGELTGAVPEAVGS
jgi:hypothetical protein